MQRPADVNVCYFFRFPVGSISGPLSVELRKYICLGLANIIKHIYKYVKSI